MAELIDADARALLDVAGRIVDAGRRELEQFPDLVDSKHAAHITDRHRKAVFQVFLHQPIGVGDLAERLDVALTTASLLATELERAGMVERSRDPSDQRRVILRVEPRLAAFIAERRIAPMRRMLDALSPTERRALLKGLRVFAEEIERNAAS